MELLSVTVLQCTQLNINDTDSLLQPELKLLFLV